MIASKTKWLAATFAVALVAQFTPADARDGRRDDRLECRAKLDPDQEVVNAGAPDPSGQPTTGRFRLEFNKTLTEAEFKLSVNDGSALGRGHLHCARAGANGGITVFLIGDFPGFGATPGTAVGVDVDGKWIDNTTIKDANVDAVAANANCPGGIVAGSLASLADQARAGNIYVNVHSKAFTAGVARGQLVCKNDHDHDDD